METFKKIEWISGYQNRIDPEVAYYEVERIREENGGTVTAENIYQDAKDKKSKLHPEVFDKGPAAAATAYYKDRASRLLRCLVVRIDELPNAQIRAFPVVEHRPTPTAKNSNRTTAHFMPIREALQDPIYRETLLSSALAELAVFRKKYAHLSELAVLWPIVDRLAQQV